MLLIFIKFSFANPSMLFFFFSHLPFSISLINMYTYGAKIIFLIRIFATKYIFFNQEYLIEKQDCFQENISWVLAFLIPFTNSLFFKKHMPHKILLDFMLKKRERNLVLKVFRFFTEEIQKFWLRKCFFSSY